MISKGDGFIWIDRKSCFRPEINNHFFQNYYGRGGTREGGGTSSDEQGGNTMVDRERSKEMAGRAERGVESPAGTQVEELVERAPRFARLAKSITRGRTKCRMSRGRSSTTSPQKSEREPKVARTRGKDAVGRISICGSMSLGRVLSLDPRRVSRSTPDGPLRDFPD